MKKTIGICFFAGFLLLYTFGLYLLWRPEESKNIAGGPPAEKTGLEAETEREAETAESMSIQKAYVYRLYEKDGRLVVCGAESEEILFETNILFSDLDEAMQKRVRKGIDFVNESELYDFLESYSS